MDSFRYRIWLALGLAVCLASARPLLNAAAPANSAAAMRSLESWLKQPRGERNPLTNAPWARVALTRGDAERAARLLWEDHAAWLQTTRAAEMAARVIELEGLRMRFEVLSFGSTNAPPPGGRSLFIALHGGGGAPAAVNDGQWRNQVQLGRAYAPKEGWYVAPRAPTDAWNMWHQAHMDKFLARLIENFIVLARVNPDRVYVLGYSAGGDGVYQLAPRMADWWAAAAMMAGHPNEASPLGLRNVPFALQAGALDAAFKRNEVAAEWGRKLAELRQADPQGYVHFVELHAGKGHWMDLADRKAVPWMEQYTRQPLPTRVVWRQDDVTHERFYWLAVPPGTAKVNQEIQAARDGQVIHIARAVKVDRLLIRLNDEMLNLDNPVTVRHGAQILHRGNAARTLSVLAQTLQERRDPRLLFSAEIAVPLPPVE